MPWIKIKHITKSIQYSPLIDIECSPHHNFFANGMLVHNCSFCLTEENLILTSDGIKTIGDLYNAKSLPLLHDGQHTWKTPLKIMRHEHTGDIIEIVGRYKIPIRGTPDHHLKVQRDGTIQDVPMGNIRLSDKLIISISGMSVWEHEFQQYTRSEERETDNDNVFFTIQKINVEKNWHGFVYNVDMNDGTYVVDGITSKNCHESKLATPWRARDPERFIEEIQSWNPQPGSMMIHDDIFPGGKWNERFVDLWWEKGLPRIPFWCQMRADFVSKNPKYIEELSKVGLTWISLGVESCSQRILDLLKKGTTVEQNFKAAEVADANHVNLFADLIFGVPTETKEDIEANGDFIKKYRPSWLSLSTFTCYPNSVLYDECISQNWFVGDGTKPEDHYSMARYPYERRVKNIDYNFLRNKLNEFGSWKGDLRRWPK